MSTTVTIDKAGRIVVPKQIRDTLHLRAGASLQIDQQGDGFLVYPPTPDTELVKKHGMWVVRHRHSLPASTVDLIRQDREHHIQKLVRRSVSTKDSE